MYCSKCGAQVAEGTVFCGVCGQPMGGVPHVAVRRWSQWAALAGNTVAVYGDPGWVSPTRPLQFPRRCRHPTRDSGCGFSRT